MKNFSIIHNLNTIQIAKLHTLYQKMWWSVGRTMEEISILLKNSISFGVIENDTQDLVGYARVLTDEIKYAFIFDVMTLEKYRGIGLGKMIMESIIDHPKLKNITRFELTCRPDMVPFYEKFGFSENYGDDVRPMRYKKS
jgi:predicted GNAT family N-acyltransferase